MAAERTLTEYHMGVALSRMNLQVTNRTLGVGAGDILNSAGRRVGSARRLGRGDWRVSILDQDLVPTFNRMNATDFRPNGWGGA